MMILMNTTTTDDSFDRDLINHWTMFGVDSLVSKVGRKWKVEFRGKGFPVVFKTKTEASARATEWVLARARARRDATVRSVEVA
jgi:hypothetical protein